MENIRLFFLNLGQNEQFIEYTTTFLAALIFFVAGHFIAKIVANITRRIMTRWGSAELLKKFVGKIVYLLVFSIPFIAGLEVLGLNITTVLAVFGAAGLAIGLALKDSLSNLAAGVVIAVLGPFRPDDFVEISGMTGTVTTVTLFSTILTTTDNKLVIIPNNSIINNPITNYTAKTERRIDMTIGVSYDDDLQKVSEICERILQNHPQVLTKPEPLVLLTDLADSSVNFAVRPWAKTDDYWTVRAELLTSIKQELEAAGCSIPYPQQDVHMRVVNSN